MARKRGHRLAVGVVESEATDVFRGLPGVHADMEIMKDTFDDWGFLLPTILVDGTTRRPTVSNISRAFREFAASVRPHSAHRLHAV